MSAKTISVLAATVVLLTSGLVCHLLAKDSAQLDEAAARVIDVPFVVGDWRGRDEEVDQAEFDMAGANSYWMRTYENQQTKDTVLVILMCGRPGRMAVHTPEVCYRGAGYEIREEPAIVDVKEIPGSQWWSASFVKNTSTTTRLRLFWAWNSRGDWEAPTAPRWHFRGEPFLYKLYVSHDISRQSPGTAQTDPSLEFLRVFVPEMKQTLLPNTN